MACKLAITQFRKRKYKAMDSSYMRCDSKDGEKGRVLDNFYIPTRYPNGHSEGAPFEHYGPLQSDEGIQYASEIVEFARSQMA